MKLTISTAEYHTRSELSFSTLSRFVQYDVWGQRTTNYLAYLYPPPKEETDAMLMGTIVDAILTEWMEYDADAGIIWDYVVVSKRTGKHPKEILGSLEEKVHYRMKAIRSIPEVVKLFEESQSQVVLTADMYGTTLRGKLDILTDTIVADLKCTELTIDSWEKDLLDPRTRTPSQYARVVRQLAFYRLLARQNGMSPLHSRIVLAAKDWVKYYEVPQSTIDKAEALNEADIINLLSQNATDILTTFPEQTETKEVIAILDF